MTHGSETRARTTHITIRLTPDERVHILGAAERAGLMLGSYVRLVLLSAPAPRQVRRPSIDRQELVRLLGHFGMIGSNINQIARVLNGGSEADLHALDEALKALIAMRDQVLISLGRDA